MELLLFLFLLVLICHGSGKLRLLAPKCHPGMIYITLITESRKSLKKSETFWMEICFGLCLTRLEPVVMFYSRLLDK